MSKIIVLSAPSGCGKSTLINYLMTSHPEFNLHFSISATSRPPRGTEQHGKEYYFLTPEEFRRRIEADEFVEYCEVYTDRFYGTLRSEVDSRLSRGENVIMDIDVVGAANVKRCYGEHALTIFIKPPSVQALRQRLESRGTDSPEVIDQRIDRAEYEIAQAEHFDAIVVNDDLAAAQKTLLQVLNQRL